MAESLLFEAGARRRSWCIIIKMYVGLLSESMMMWSLKDYFYYHEVGGWRMYSMASVEGGYKSIRHTTRFRHCLVQDYW